MRRGRLLAILFIVIWASSCPAASVTTYPFQGVTLIHRTETSPRNLDIHVALIDTLAPGISFATSPESPHSNDMVIAQTTRAFMTQVGAQLAINGDFYSSPGSFGGFPHRNPTTFAASYGNIYSPFEVGRPAINIQKNNVAHTVVASSSSTAGKLQPNPAVPVWNAGGGWDYLLNNGTQPAYITNPSDWRYAFANELHPRTAMGISADRRTIAMFVVDGRQSDSGGMNFPEMAAMLKNDYGMHWALNLDGGGSTTMAIANPSPHVLNDPSDGSERSVGNSWAVFARPTPAAVPAQAVAKVFQQQTGIYQHGGAEIRSAAPTTNFATDTDFRVGYDTSQGKSRGVLSFDLSAIGRSSTIHSISLTLDALSSSGATGYNYVDLELFKLGSQTTESQVTWNQRASGISWTPGGDITGRSLSSLLAQQTTGTKTFVSTIDFVAVAQSSLSAGTPLNMLVTALNAETWGAANAANLNLRFRSDDATSGVRPYLTIQYTPGPLVGDFNQDNVVDVADYITWRKSAGTIYGPAEYTAWRANFGKSSGGAAGAGSGDPRTTAAAAGSAVPEPAAVLFLAVGALAACCRRTRTI